jgi:hypothetical protein
LLLGVPFAVVGAVPRAAMDDLATAAARPLVGAAAELEAALPEDATPTPLPPTPEADAIAAIGADEEGDISSERDGRAPRPTMASSRATPGNGGSPLPARGVMVNRARVLAAAKAGIRPSGSSVAATPYRPSGLALHGVGIVGVGLRDGDVVTRVGGARATSQGAVIGAVTAALRQKLPAITAEVWRGRHRILVTVELPEVEFEDDQDEGQRAAP